MEPRGTPPGSPHGVRPLAAPFPPPGPPRRVPRLRRYYGAVRLPGSLSPRFVSFAWRYQALCLSFRSPQSRSPNRGPGVRQPVSRPVRKRLETIRVSQVPGESSCAYALLFDPGRTDGVRPYNAVGAAPVMSTTKAPTTNPISGLHHTALALAVYASWSGSPQPTRKTRFPLWATLYGTGLVTRRILTKGF